jgi:cell division protein FtsN
LLATTASRTVVTSPRFTVQVASYRVRPQAEALRDSLASAGHDARIVEGDAHGPVYRVQVGEFSTREAARALAARLSGERASVAPIVTPR